MSRKIYVNLFLFLATPFVSNVSFAQSIGVEELESESLVQQLEHLKINKDIWFDELDTSDKKSLSLILKNDELGNYNFNLQSEQISSLTKLRTDLNDPSARDELLKLVKLLGKDRHLAISRPVLGNDEAQLVSDCSNKSISPGAIFNQTVGEGLQNLSLSNCNKSQAVAISKFVNNDKIRDRCLLKADELLTKTNTASYVIEEYLKACGIRHVSAMKARKKWEAVVGRVGVFIHPLRGVFCTGFLLNSNTIITARHCSYNDYGNIDEAVGQPWLEHSETSFEFYGEYRTLTQLEYTVDDSACNGVYRDSTIDKTIQACDFIKLTLNEPVDNIVEVAVSKSVQLFDYLNPIGYHYYQHLATRGKGLDSAKELDPSSWRDGLISNELPTCSVYEEKVIDVNGTSSRCIKHGCQTIKKMSGSPVFGIEDNQIILVAVHIGFNGWSASGNSILGSWSSSSACGFQQSEDGLNFRNIAVAISN